MEKEEMEEEKSVQEEDTGLSPSHTRVARNQHLMLTPVLTQPRTASPSHPRPGPLSPPILAWYLL